MELSSTNCPTSGVFRTRKVHALVVVRVYPSVRQTVLVESLNKINHSPQSIDGILHWVAFGTWRVATVRSTTPLAGSEINFFIWKIELVYGIGSVSSRFDFRRSFGSGLRSSPWGWRYDCGLIIPNSGVQLITEIQFSDRQYWKWLLASQGKAASKFEGTSKYEPVFIQYFGHEGSLGPQKRKKNSNSRFSSQMPRMLPRQYFHSCFLESEILF